jgi:uncharacterized protein DUF5972
MPKKIVKSKKALYERPTFEPAGSFKVDTGMLGVVYPNDPLGYRFF